jgi:hypothetical protein
VHFEIHAEGFGEVGDLDQCRDAAFDRDVAAQKVGGALEDPRDIGIQAADRVFGRKDRDVELLFEFDVIVEILVGERVLAFYLYQPSDSRFFAGEPERWILVLAT